MRCTHQGVSPGLYPQLYMVGCANKTPLGLSWEGKHIKPDNHEPEDLPSEKKSTTGAGVPQGVLYVFGTIEGRKPA